MSQSGCLLSRALDAVREKKRASEFLVGAASATKFKNWYASTSGNLRGVVNRNFLRTDGSGFKLRALSMYNSRTTKLWYTSSTDNDNYMFLPPQ